MQLSLTDSFSHPEGHLGAGFAPGSGQGSLMQQMSLSQQQMYGQPQAGSSQYPQQQSLQPTLVSAFVPFK